MHHINNRHNEPGKRVQHVKPTTPAMQIWWVVFSFVQGQQNGPIKQDGFHTLAAHGTAAPSLRTHPT